MLLSFIHKFTHGLVREATYALIDDPLREAFGFPKASSWVKAMAEGALRLRGRLLRYFPPRREPRHITEKDNRSYPHGYTIEALGPADVPADPPRPSQRATGD